MTPAQIKALRQRFSETQEDFARHIGVGLKTVWNWENGNTAPNRLGLIRLNQIERQVDMPAAAGVEL